MPRNKKKKIKKTKRFYKPFSFILFIVLCIYLSVYTISLFSREKTSIEIATIGEISNTIKAEAIVIKNEKLVYAKNDGNLFSYYSNGEKVKKDSIICSIQDKNKIQELNSQIDSIDYQISKIQNSRKDLSWFNQDIKRINNRIDIDMSNFYNTSNNNYTKIYNISSNIRNNIDKRTQIYASENVNSIQNYIESRSNILKLIENNTNNLLSPIGGIVSYNIDGYEEKYNINNISSFTEEDFNIENNTKYILKDAYKKGEVVFKIINNDKWHLVCIIANEDINNWKINTEKIINIKDFNIKISAIIENIKPLEKNSIVSFAFNKSLYNFIDIRKVEIDIIEDSYHGIKLPVNSIAQKTFFKLPKEAIIEKEGVQGIIKITNEEREFIPINISFEDNDYLYIIQDFTFIHLRDNIFVNSHNYIIDEISEPISGVYVANKGIAKFKKIKIIGSNSESVIVDSNFKNSIRLYDEIISDSKTIEENNIIE